jgi:hypothetical protein
MSPAHAPIHPRSLSDCKLLIPLRRRHVSPVHRQLAVAKRSQPWAVPYNGCTPPTLLLSHHGSERHFLHPAHAIHPRSLSDKPLISFRVKTVTLPQLRSPLWISNHDSERHFLYSAHAPIHPRSHRLCNQRLIPIRDPHRQLVQCLQVHHCTHLLR